MFLRRLRSSRSQRCLLRVRFRVVFALPCLQWLVRVQKREENVSRYNWRRRGKRRRRRGRDWRNWKRGRRERNEGGKGREWKRLWKRNYTQFWWIHVCSSDNEFDNDKSNNFYFQFDYSLTYRVSGNYCYSFLLWFTDDLQLYSRLFWLYSLVCSPQISIHYNQILYLHNYNHNHIQHQLFQQFLQLFLHNCLCLLTLSNLIVVAGMVMIVDLLLRCWIVKQKMTIIPDVCKHYYNSIIESPNYWLITVN